jgi:hypothetical protein
MPARKAKKFFRRKVLKYLILLTIFALMVFLIGLFRCRNWDGNNKLNVVIGGSGDVNIINLNPKDGEMTKIIIPGNTEFELSRGLGKMRAKNVWQLGFNEGLRGDLLSETVTKNLKISTYSWTCKEGDALWGGNMKSLPKLLFGNCDTNLSFGDRFKIALFALRVNDYKKVEVNLLDSQLLVKTKLNDGEEGYELSNRIPRQISILASDERLSGKNLKFKIIDSVKEKGISEELGKIVESLGAKITIIEESDDKDVDCVLYTDIKDVGEFLKNTFSCKVEKKARNSNYDIELLIGSKFSKRF